MRSFLPQELVWLYRRIRSLLGWHLASFGLLTVASVLALLNPLMLMWVVDRAIPYRDVSLLIIAVVIIFAGSQLRSTLTGFGAYLTLRASQLTALHIRMEIFGRLDLLSAEYHERIPTGQRLYVLREPIEEVAYFGSNLVPVILRTLLVTTFTLCAMVALNPRLTLLVLPAVPAFLVVRHRYRMLLARRSDVVHAARAESSAFLEEHLSTVIQIQQLQLERRQERRAFHSFCAVLRSQVRLSAGQVQFATWTNLPIAAAAALIIGFGAWASLRGAMTVGALVAFYGYVFQLFEPLAGGVESYAQAQRTFSSIRYLQSILNLKPAVTDKPGATYTQPLAHYDIAFIDVSFGYERLKGFLSVPRLFIREGERVAIVGENGAGKSTFAKLAARVYDTETGTISIGGVSFDRIPLSRLRALVSYVPSVPLLFDATLLDNLRLDNRDLESEQIEAAIDLVELHSLVVSLPRGLSQPIGPAGCLLSEGQRQRVALARALLRRPRVLILDEGTSAIEPTSELSMLQAISRFLPGITILFVSHRLSNLPWLDRILVFQRGRIAEDGCHHDLSSTGTLYRELQQSPPLSCRPSFNSNPPRWLEKVDQFPNMNLPE